MKSPRLKFDFLLFKVTPTYWILEEMRYEFQRVLRHNNSKFQNSKISLQTEMISFEKLITRVHDALREMFDVHIVPKLQTIEDSEWVREREMLRQFFVIGA